MKSKPAVSIGMPVYNGARFLRASVESVLAQTFADFELIIADNASTDATEEICREYASKDHRIRYFRNQHNIGASPNFNRVFELSYSDFFRWQAADDLCEPTLVEKCKSVLDADPAVVLCCPRSDVIDESGTVIERIDDVLDLRSRRPSDRFRGLLAKLTLCNAQYGLMRSEALRKTRLEQSYPGSDIVFLAELTLQGEFVQLDEYLFHRRFHAAAHSSLMTSEEKQRFSNPAIERRIFLRRWRNLLEHCRSIKRARLSILEKIELLVEVARLAYWWRKDLIREIGDALWTLMQASLKRWQASTADKRSPPGQ
jgi:glycosyltransferase involved in cell wall biosynthesis